MSGFVDAAMANATTGTPVTRLEPGDDLRCRLESRGLVIGAAVELPVGCGFRAACAVCGAPVERAEMWVEAEPEFRARLAAEQATVLWPCRHTEADIPPGTGTMFTVVADEVTLPESPFTCGHCASRSGVFVRTGPKSWAWVRCAGCGRDDG